MPCTPEYMEEILRPVKEVTRWDLEGLVRMYSDEELVELWNEIRHSMRRYLRECSYSTSEKLDKYYRGLFQLAQLLIAASFRSRGIDRPGITDRFRDEEYEVILDFEKYKIFDGLDIDEIVEYIERREGRVYEFIKEYYSKQYNALDRAWGHLLRDMMTVIEKRYQKRREKMENAAIAYIRKRGILGSIFEIEEAVKKAMEAGEVRRQAVESIGEIAGAEDKLGSRLEELLSKAEEALKGAVDKGEYSRLIGEYEELRDAISTYAEKLKGILGKLGVKYEELSRLQFRGSAKEIVEAEINALSSIINELQAKLSEYEGLLKGIEAEKEALEKRVVELEKVLSGAEEGPVVTIGDVCGLLETYLSRVWSKASKDLGIYSPLEDRTIKIGSWSEKSIVGGTRCNRGLILVKKKGIIGKHRHIVIEVASIVHWDNLENKGYDNVRAGLSEILSLLSRRIPATLSENYYHILIIASPTGFTSRALEIVSGEYYRRFSLKNITLYLVDLLSVRLYYNEMDKASRQNSWIAEPEYEHEIIKRIIDYVLSDEALFEANKNGPPPYLPVSYIEARTGKPGDMVRVALEKLSSMGKGRVARLSTGDIVFIYRL